MTEPESSASLSLAGAKALPELIGGRYRSIRLIGQGGMGAVYEVEHTNTGDRLALKVLIGRLGSSQEALDRFKREARASARIKSDNVVRVTDAGIAPELHDAPFLVMELLEGLDLEEVASTRELGPAIVVDWMRQVARAIDKAHRLGIVHRDLKPENVFLANREQGAPIIKVLDFGIAKMAEEGGLATNSGQILGTPRYMAPEQASGRTGEVGPATDVFAIGLIVFRLLSGTHYFRGATVIKLIAEVLHDEIEAPSLRGCSFGPEFDAWFLKICARDPAQRYATAAIAIEELARALGVEVLSLESAPAASPSGSGAFAGRLRTPSGNAAMAEQTTLAASADSAPSGNIGARVASVDQVRSQGVASPDQVSATGAHSASLTLSGLEERPRRGSAVWIAVSVVAVACAGLGIFFATRTSAETTPPSASGSAELRGAAERPNAGHPSAEPQPALSAAAPSAIAAEASSAIAVEAPSAQPSATAPPIVSSRPRNTTHGSLPATKPTIDPFADQK